MFNYTCSKSSLGGDLKGRRGNPEKKRGPHPPLKFENKLIDIKKCKEKQDVGQKHNVKSDQNR